MINFNQDSVFNLKEVDNSLARDEINNFLIDGEEVISVFKTIRDQIIFTNKRIISINVQGITGKKKSYSSMPYSKIQYFTVQTPGFIELFADSELFIKFTDGFEASFEFKAKVDILKICKSISTYVL